MFIYNILKSIYDFICKIFTKDVQIAKIYDMNSCEIRYNLLSYKRERIKEIIIPPYIKKNTLKKILYDINEIIKNKSFKIKRLKKGGSIYLYEDDSILNNEINNIITYHYINEN